MTFTICFILLANAAAFAAFRLHGADANACSRVQQPSLRAVQTDFVVFLTVLSVLLATPARQAIAQTFKPINFVGGYQFDFGGTPTSANGINNVGQIVGIGSGDSPFLLSGGSFEAIPSANFFQ